VHRLRTSRKLGKQTRLQTTASSPAGASPPISLRVRSSICFNNTKRRRHRNYRLNLKAACPQELAILSLAAFTATCHDEHIEISHEGAPLDIDSDVKNALYGTTIKWNAIANKTLEQIDLKYDLGRGAKDELGTYFATQF
jgi:hypothetical protein